MLLVLAGPTVCGMKIGWRSPSSVMGLLPKGTSTKVSTSPASTIPTPFSSARTTNTQSVCLLTKQTRAETIAQKAVAYGITGVRVDGNDALAVYQVTKEAADRARKAEGPTLIEAAYHRVGPHTMAGDDPGRYRTKEEEESWTSKRDPLNRMRKYLEAKGLWSDEEEEKTVEEWMNEMNETIKKVEKMPKGTVADLIDDLYTETPAILKKQKDEYLSWKEGK